jgi:exonuclease SbcC
VSEKERKIRDCEGCFEHLDEKKRIEKSRNMTELAIKETGKKIQKYQMGIVSLKEQLSLAKKLQLENGKCPVCDSNVDHLNPLFQEKHLTDEQNNIKKKIVVLENQHEMYEKKKQDFSNVFQQIIENEATLRAHSINDKNEIYTLKKEISLQKITIQKIPININSGLLLEVASIDSHAKLLYEQIMELENETKNFNENSFSVLRNSLEIKQQELSETDQKLGGILEKIRNSKEFVDKNTLIVKELVFVKDYVSQINEIQENLFNRDGSVATSLRSWALHTISAKASEYLDMLNTKIQRIELSEKTRDVSITCYSKNTVLDLESLSGGEQVSIALALRLGMTQLLGSSNLNFIILDEPTMFLDEERKKSLVNVLSQLSDITNSLKSNLQFIIITHDSEIFEDSSVEQIFKFESTNNGTVVTSI